MAVGTDAGMALTIAPKEAYLGDASSCDEIKGKPERKTYICVNRDMPGIEMKTKGCSILLKEDQLIGSAKESFSFSAKSVSLRGRKKTFIG
jgi:hypothetical protein